MEKDTILRCLARAADALKLKTEGNPAYGWHYKSVGSKVSDSAGNIRWLRILARTKDQKNDRVWFGLKSAGEIQGVNKPAWFGDYEWEEENLRSRADILEFISDTLISDSPELRSEIQLSEKWLGSLRVSLECLRHAKTDRVAVRQDLVTRRLRERFGEKVDAEIKEWETNHGDLHWANLTTPVCWLLDWEAWGTAPKGFDVALLYCFTLQQPKTAKMVYESFKDWLDTPSGNKAQMFACAELMRMSELYSDHPQLYPCLANRAEELASPYGLSVSKPK